MVKHLGIYCDCGGAVPGGLSRRVWGIVHLAAVPTLVEVAAALLSLSAPRPGRLSWVLGYISSQTIPTATFTALCIS